MRQELGRSHVANLPGWISAQTWGDISHATNGFGVGDRSQKSGKFDSDGTHNGVGHLIHRAGLQAQPPWQHWSMISRRSADDHPTIIRRSSDGDGLATPRASTPNSLSSAPCTCQRMLSGREAAHLAFAYPLRATVDEDGRQRPYNPPDRSEHTDLVATWSNARRPGRHRACGFGASGLSQQACNFESDGLTTSQGSRMHCGLFNPPDRSEHTALVAMWGKRRRPATRQRGWGCRSLNAPGRSDRTALVAARVQWRTTGAFACLPRAQDTLQAV